MKYESFANISERKERLRDGLGLVLCTRQKDAENAPLDQQVGLAHEMHLPAVQFDLRNRTDEEVMSSLDRLKSFREQNAESSISMHGETPKIDHSTLEISNGERIKKELELTRSLGGESHTIHPPNVSSGVFEHAPEEVRRTVVENYARLFTQSLKASIDDGTDFSIAIENMPTKGSDGAWGQSPEELELLISTVSEVVSSELGIGTEEVLEHVGMTFDINHALHGVEDEKAADFILGEWFARLGKHIRVVHVYMPSGETDSFAHKYKKSIELAALHAPHGRIFLESKNGADSTRQIYASAKEIRI